MRERICYRIELELMSALSIGAADSLQTDHDVVLDSRGRPLLPGTSLAGLYRSYFDEVRALEIFGEVVEQERDRVLAGLPNDERARIQGRDGHRCDESAVRVYDGEWMDGNATVSVRDSVALRDKVAVDKLKFDRQAVQAGARFVTRIEVIDTTRCAAGDVEGVISAIHAGELQLGSKTTRGFGRLEVRSCLRRTFGTDDVDDWLAFDLFGSEDSPSWSAAVDLTEQVIASRLSTGVELRFQLGLRGGISVREYSTEPSTDAEAKPDYGQMVVHGKRDAHGLDIPVIPGTSWAGALRDRYRQLAGKERERELFGYVDANGGGDGEGSLSRISLSETTLEGGEWKTITRNAIDRFTGGTLDGALYTERTYYGGTTELVLQIQDMEGLDESHLAPLVCTLADLHNGLLAVGGLTSVGRGLFRILDAELSVDGEPRTGFAEALRAPAGVDGLVCPDAKAVAGMFFAKGGDA